MQTIWPVQFKLDSMFLAHDWTVEIEYTNLVQQKELKS